MDNNEYNRRIRYALQLDDAETQRLIRLGLTLEGQSGNESALQSQIGPFSLERVAAWRSKDDEPSFESCPDAALLALLDGLVLDRRGPAPAAPSKDPAPSAHSAVLSKQPVKPSGGNAASAASPVSLGNNVVLKQLRIALSLRTEQVHELIISGGGRLGKTEVSAFFRNPQARNFRRCGDQVVRWFLSGLAKTRNNSGD